MIEGLLLFLMILLSGVFSGSQVAYMTSNRLKLEITSRREVVGARSLAHMLRHPETFLATTLIANHLVNVTFITVLVVSASALPLTWMFAIALTAILLMGEILPKAVSRTHPDSILAALAGPIRVLSVLLHPFVRVVSASSGSIARGLSVESAPQISDMGRSDIEMLFREIGDHSGSQLDKDDSEILSNMMELSNIRVRESMVPRTDIVAIEKTATLEEARKAFIQSGFSKLPVYEDTIDHVIGVVVAYDLFNQPKLLESILRPVKHVPATQRSKDLLAEFRHEKLNMAIVIDEYGGTAGIITIEDLLEEVVGDIQDEYDVEDTILKPLSDTSWLISGNVEIETLVETVPQLRFPTEQDDFETLAGYVMHMTGRIPDVNEEVDIGSYRFTITKGTRSRIELVKLQLLD